MQTPTPTTDPAALVGYITTFVGALLGLVVAFGVELSAEQLEAILALVAVAAPALVAWLIRRRAWAPGTVATAVDVARRGVTDGTLPGAELDRRLEVARWTDELPA